MMTSEMNGVILVCLEKSKISGLKLTKLETNLSKSSSSLFSKGYTRCVAVQRGNKGVNILSLKAKFLEVETLTA
jgi:hypothetical protein